MKTIGQRVGAILYSEKDNIYFFGFGRYIGDFIPEEAVGPFAYLCRIRRKRDPKLRLDNGNIIYGCECWWDSEWKVKEILSKYKNIIKIDINKYRKDYYE